MAGVNRVILLGNLGKDPEVRHLEGGVTVANFPMATSETYKDKQGVKQEKTEWHNIVVWRGLADVAEKYLKKGSKIYLEGKLQTRGWEKDGVKRYTTEIVGENFVMLDRKPAGDDNNNPSGGTTTETSNTSANTGTGSDDLPF